VPRDYWYPNTRSSWCKQIVSIKELKARSISLTCIYNLRAPGTGKSPGIVVYPGTTAPRTSCSPRSKFPRTLVGPGGLWVPENELRKGQNYGGF
jgi:hypothetical protein